MEFHRSGIDRYYSQLPTDRFYAINGTLHPALFLSLSLPLYFSSFRAFCYSVSRIIWKTVRFPSIYHEHETLFRRRYCTIYKSSKRNKTSPLTRPYASAPVAFAADHLTNNKYGFRSAAFENRYLLRSIVSG